MIQRRQRIDPGSLDGEREPTAAERLEAAARRDQAAGVRDRNAYLRDDAARERDEATMRCEAELDRFLLARAGGGDAQDGEQAARLLARCAEQITAYRHLAAEDREAAARDRLQAARDRLRALADREMLARELAIDSLTGARTRAAGLADLEQEIDRCRTSCTALTAVFVDVVALKAVNDRDGHRAGDELLRRVAERIGSELHFGDVLLRLGGREFVCALPGTTMSRARARFEAILAGLQESAEVDAIRLGFAQLEPGDRAPELIARADQDLIAGRGGGQATPARSNARTAS